MFLWNIITLVCAATILAEAKWNHHQKRDAAFSICDPVYNNTNKVQCYCIKDPNEPQLVKSADCYLTNESVKPNDTIWNEFKTLKNATKLTLTNTRGITLTYIPTNGIKLINALVKLDVKYANIETLSAFAFANSSTLQEITLRDNQIQTLEVNAFAHHSEVTVISLDTNNIVEINRNVFVDLPNIEKLYLTSNKITTLHDKAFLHLMNLKELEIDRNSLFSLNSETFSGLKNLQKLDLSSNSLEVIGDNTFMPLVNLESLNLEGNKIEMLDDKAFNGLGKLLSLSLAHNKLTDLDNVKVFDGLKSLISLSLRGNQIRQLKPEVMAPILINFYGNTSSIDVEDNNFPCSCRLDWFTSLMNKTRNGDFKLAIENLKCSPDANLRETWTKIQDVEKNKQAVEDEGTDIQNNDYEYYDDTQLNGKLFYTDVRELLNCTKASTDLKTTIQVDTTTKTTIKFAETTKAISSLPTTTTTTTTTTTKPTITSTTHIPEQQSLQSTTKITKDNEPSTGKSEPFTTTKLATVSDNPLKNNIYQEMASDEAKPDKIKAHRSIQDVNDTNDYGRNNANINISCISLLFFLLCLKCNFN